MAEAAIAIACLAAAALAALRWLRVVQREQYYVAAVRFAWRWWRQPANLALWALAMAGLLVSLLIPFGGLLTAAGVAVGPLGLGLRGRTAPLAWTRRMSRLGFSVVLLDAIGLTLTSVGLVAAGFAVGHAVAVGAALVALAQPALVDLALLLTRPVERRLMGSFITRAERRLAQVRPAVVAVTGSYGKTSTKGYIRHLLAPVRAVVASPASFNNSGGLARAINEALVPGTDVFIAEMGTYGPGEIRELCRWLPPDVAVITAIGPVHLERMGSLDAIVRNKAEILERARVCVLNVDAHGLAEVAERLAGDRQVWRCSTNDPGADVHATNAEGTLRVQVRGEELATVADSMAHPINVACAVAAALALDVPVATLRQQLPTLPSAEHRLQVASSEHGPTVLDDTYNSNPAGARAALDALLRKPAARRALVTPGMIELGPIQARENEAFGREAAAAVDELLVVNRTNRSALLHGAAGGRANVHSFDRREQAVAWVRANLGPDDAVLYENDLPDIYP